MKKILSIGTMVIALTGCSSIISKSEYAVAIASNPAASTFTVVNRAGQPVHSGVTPATVTLKSSAGYFKGEIYTFTFKKDGHPDKTFTMNSSIDGWYFGNILLGGFIGMLIVDPATGAMYNLPNRIDVSLDPAIASTAQEQLTIAAFDSLSEDEKTKLIKIN